ncbi:hypothetical protein ES705_10554 [subsurface metagenome]
MIRDLKNTIRDYVDASKLLALFLGGVLIGLIIGAVIF